MSPNGKTVIFREDSLLGTNQFLSRISEINNPNSTFVDLDIHHFKYSNPNANTGIAPSNFSYMRLGADTLSICDSLSVITKKSANKEPSGLVVFPNPATNYLQIEKQEQSNTQYKIINYYGQVVYLWESAEPKQTLDLSSNQLTNGLYVLQATNSQGKINQQKFIVQN
jgi:hypothetical protein